MKTIKIILLLFCIILGLNAKAQTVGYTYKALAAEGCNMKYSVAKQDTIYSIIATVRSDRMNFLAEPTMKIRLSCNSWGIKFSQFPSCIYLC